MAVRATRITRDGGKGGSITSKGVRSLSGREGAGRGYPSDSFNQAIGSARSRGASLGAKQGGVVPTPFVRGFALSPNGPHALGSRGDVSQKKAPLFNGNRNTPGPGGGRSRGVQGGQGAGKGGGPSRGAASRVASLRGRGDGDGYGAGRPARRGMGEADGLGMGRRVRGRGDGDGEGAGPRRGRGDGDGYGMGRGTRSASRASGRGGRRGY